jgi:hypothetical protein
MRAVLRGNPSRLGESRSKDVPPQREATPFGLLTRSPGCTQNLANFEVQQRRLSHLSCVSGAAAYAPSDSFHSITGHDTSEAPGTPSCRTSYTTADMCSSVHCEQTQRGHQPPLPNSIVLCNFKPLLQCRYQYRPPPPPLLPYQPITRGQAGPYHWQLQVTGWVHECLGWYAQE